MFAERALAVLGSKSGNRLLTDFFRSTFIRLIENDIIKTRITPDSGYFVFAAPMIKLPSAVQMGAEYFELKGYPGYVRVNLMAAHRLLGRERKRNARCCL
jgi:hypothetical protein